METDKIMQRIARISEQIAPVQASPLARENGTAIRPGVESAPTLGLGQPALQLELAFPQATPASKFPPSVSDFFQLDDLLTDEDRAVRDRVRGIMEKEVAPFIAQYYERAEFPFELLPSFAKLKVSGGTITGNECPGMSILSKGLAMAEIARVDASICTFMMAHSGLGMFTIDLFGNDEQKQRWLPALARLDLVTCWGLTEPSSGSDASSMYTTATKVEGGWQVNGQKRWIGNASFADILVIMARNTQTNEINGFVTKKGTTGLSVTKIENKIGLRIAQNCDIVLRNVFVPDEDRLPNLNSFQDVKKVLAFARLLVAWQPIGLCMGVYDVCHRYLLERTQFGHPLAAFQLNQEKLMRMLGHIQAMFLMGWRLSKIYEAGKMTLGQASLAKSWNTKLAREVTSMGRELLGGNGILTDFNVAKAFCDLEPIYTYEGSYEINTLIAGREATRITSFRPAVNTKTKPS